MSSLAKICEGQCSTSLMSLSSWLVHSCRTMRGLSAWLGVTQWEHSGAYSGVLLLLDQAWQRSCYGSSRAAQMHAPSRPRASASGTEMARVPIWTASACSTGARPEKPLPLHKFR